MREREELISRIGSAEERLAVLSMREQSSSLLSMNLTVQQFQVLLVLWTEGPVPAHAIADVLHVGANAVTGIVDRLVTKALVQRRESTHDRRLRLVELTTNGRQLIDDLTANAKAQRRRLLERLSTETLHQFEQVLTEMTEVISTAEPANGHTTNNPGTCAPKLPPGEQADERHIR